MVLWLLEMAVGTADEGVRVLELAVEVFPFLHVLDLDVHGEAFGYDLQVMAKAFNQHACVPFDLFDLLINLLIK